MRQNGSFGCRHCSSASEHKPTEYHVHTYNIAGVCTTCGRDADAMATEHHFCEQEVDMSACCTRERCARMTAAPETPECAGDAVEREDCPVCGETPSEFPPVARDWKPAFHQPCDVCTMPCAWGHTGEGWTSYLCMNCYDAMVERLKMSRERAIGRMEAESERKHGEYAVASEPWTPKNQPQPADVVPSITGDSGEVWIFQGVKVATHTDINAAFAMRDKINQAGEQWLSAMGYATQQDRHGALSTPAAPQPETCANGHRLIRPDEPCDVCQPETEGMTEAHRLVDRRIAVLRLMSDAEWRNTASAEEFDRVAREESAVAPHRIEAAILSAAKEQSK